jgi:8-oxo-dGTP pyrophosphatase MutT (NUDIX family)
MALDAGLRSLREHGWETLDVAYRYEHRMFRIREDLLRWPDGHVAPYTYIEVSGAVWIVPVTDDGLVVLIRQLRYTTRDWCWEVPAGGFHDFSGTVLELAEKELAEEVGGEARQLIHVGSFRAGVSLLDEECHIVLAQDVTLSLEPQREPGEIIEVQPVPASRAFEMARSGEIEDGFSSLALLRCEAILTR